MFASTLVFPSKTRADESRRSAINRALRRRSRTAARLRS
jgi:hypothetical protein